LVDLFFPLPVGEDALHLQTPSRDLQVSEAVTLVVSGDFEDLCTELLPIDRSCCVQVKAAEKGFNSI
jgi:hypothetical protein